MTDTPTSHPDLGDYDCQHLPGEPAGDLELMAHFRARVGDAVVNEQVAVFGADHVLASMQRAHRSHLAALALSPAQLHRRAELMESLMSEFEVPALGAAAQTTTDVGRVQLLIQIVKGFADRAIEAQMAMDAAARVFLAESDDPGGPDPAP